LVSGSVGTTNPLTKSIPFLYGFQQPSRCYCLIHRHSIQNRQIIRANTRIIQARCDFRKRIVFLSRIDPQPVGLCAEYSWICNSFEASNGLFQRRAVTSKIRCDSDEFIQFLLILNEGCERRDRSVLSSNSVCAYECRITMNDGFLTALKNMTL